jgi:putative zinc finger protein
VTCAEVRDRLAEYALDMLPPDEAAEVERHLDWCAGCRKEAGELQEAAASLALESPQADPPDELGDRVVRTVSHAARPRRAAPRRGVRLLAAATLAAVLALVLAVGWGVAQRQSLEDVQARTEQLRQDIQHIRGLVQDLGGRQAALAPVGTSRGSGTAVVVPLPRGQDYAFAEVVLFDQTHRPFTVEFVDGDGKVVLSGQLIRSNNGTDVVLERTDQDLLRVVSVEVKDSLGRVVLRGDVQPAVASPAPAG